MCRFKVHLLIFTLVLSSCFSLNKNPSNKDELKKGIYAKIITEKGVIIARLEYEKVPLTVANFIGLAQGLIPNDIKKPGEPYYDGLKFYKVYKGYMAITGCPQNNGTGQPGYFFLDEFNPELKHDAPGILSMLSNGPNTNGSQFVITLRPSIVLNNKNPVFGKVVKGMEVVNEIQQGDMVLKIEIIKIGKKAKSFNPVKEMEKYGFSDIMKNK